MEYLGHASVAESGGPRYLAQTGVLPARALDCGVQLATRLVFLLGGLA
jgi:hypothetical protein